MADRATHMILDAVDGTPASYLRAARELSSGTWALEPIALSVASTFTYEPVVPYIAVEGARWGLGVATAVAPFGQLEQQVLDARSGLYAGKPDVVVLAIRAEDVAPDLVSGFVGLAPAELPAALAGQVARIANLVRAVRARSPASIVVWNQPPPAALAAGLADPSLEIPQAHAVAELNRQIAREVAAVGGACVFDVHRLAEEIGLGRWEDKKLLHLARIPFSAEAQRAIGRRFARLLRAIRRTPRKCLVLDLDDTLWGGILGEEGAAGVVFGDDWPGNAFKAFHRCLLALRARGILLAIASKNNEPDVLEVFRQRSDLLLRLEHFSARQIHWRDKATSLRAIADQLSIGTDALAFFDDNPVERAFIASQMPEVCVIDVPADIAGYGEAIEASGAFDTLAITPEDRARAALYQSDSRRDALASTAASVEEFLLSLQMKVHVEPITASNLARVAQLVAKTNQFNLTTRRHTRPQIERMLEDGAIGLASRVVDRFGDNGLVGVAIALERGDRRWAIDTFLLSCRVLGRQVERAMLCALARRVASRGARELFGEFLPTRKNAPASRFFADAGFQELGQGSWLLPLDQAPTSPPVLQLVEAI